MFSFIAVFCLAGCGNEESSDNTKTEQKKDDQNGSSDTDKKKKEDGSSDKGSSDTGKDGKDKAEKTSGAEDKYSKYDTKKYIVKSKYTKNKPLIIEIDPGHGGDDSGSYGTHNGVTIIEKDLNIRIAKYLKRELSKYDNVKILMAREGDENPTIEQRVEKAGADNADVLISVHNNAKGGDFRYTDGTMVLAATGNLDAKKAEKDQKLGAYILRELKGLGIAERGLLLRYSENGETYENGKITDYYGIVRRCALKGITGIIIEHAYIDNQQDYENFLSTKKKLKNLAKADARGIAAFYRLVPVLREAERYETQTIKMVDEKEEHNVYTPISFELNKIDK